MAKARKAKKAKVAQPTRISDTAMAFARQKRPTGFDAAAAFSLPPQPAPGTLPEGKTAGFAADADITAVSAWATSQMGGFGGFGPLFMGYPQLALLATLPEYRRAAEVLATECVRKWIRITGDKESQAKVDELKDKLESLDVRGAFRRLIEIDAWFGRAHLYLDTGDSDDRGELVKSIGNGRSPVTAAKFSGEKNFLRGVKPIEPVWCYPAQYNSIDPLTDDWYAPETWFVQGKEVHRTRLLRFIGREVPDLLKPTYMFGGISLSQLLKPYVDRWVNFVEAVSDLGTSFSVSGIRTKLDTLLAPEAADGLFRRIDFFNEIKNNRGTMILDKDSEEFFNITTPLGTLDVLMAQMQEHLCSISGTPVVKLLGIQPAGLNASSQGELTSWYDWVSAYQERFCQPHLNQVIDFVQLSLWGEIDESIVVTFEPLEELTAQEESAKQLTDAQRDQVYMDAGVLAPPEVRNKLINDTDSPYSGLEVLGDGPEGEGEFEPTDEDKDLLDGFMGGEAARRAPDERRPGLSEGAEPRRDSDRLRTPRERVREPQV